MMDSFEQERARLAAVRSYGLLDRANEPPFDFIVLEAARILRTPVALISLVDEYRQWFTARIGLEIVETPRTISFCTHAIRGNDLFIVEDASRDARFCDNPLVSGQPGIRFYAGMPLKTPSGMRIGTLCVIDFKRHPPLTTSQRGALAQLAQHTMRAMELRRVRSQPLAMAL